MYYSLSKSFSVLLALITTTSANLVITLPLPVAASPDSPVPNSSSQVGGKQTLPSLSAQSRVQKAKEVFNQGYQEYQQNRYSEAEKSLWAALEVLNGGHSRMQGFQAPRTRKRGTSFHLLSSMKFDFSSTTPVGTSEIRLPIPLDEAYVRIINSLSQGNDPISTMISVTVNEINDEMRGQNTTTSNSVSENVINSVEDGHKVEIDIFRLLQRTLIAQNREDKT